VRFPPRLHLLILVLVLAAAGVGGWIATHRRPVDFDGTLPDDSSNKPPAEPLWFEDRTATSGVHFVYRNGEEAEQFTILESLGGGVALFDYDGDGRLDIFFTGGGTFESPTKLRGQPCKLFRNLGGFRFEDVTERVGLNRTWPYTHGVAVADYDRDGWPDLFITGFGEALLLRNVAAPGGRCFEEVGRSLGLIDDSWSTGAAWADFNGDGWPDIYVSHYLDWSFKNNPPCPGFVPGVARDVCPPGRFKPLIHSLFVNERGKKFREVGREHGFTASGCGLSVVAADLNGDARPDFYVANDTTNNFLFANCGGKLQEIGQLAGVAVDENGTVNGSMGVDVADYDGTGRASIFVTNFQGELHALYRNLGTAPPREAFDYQSRSAGIASLGVQNVSFGTVFFDPDNDGWEDLMFVNGHVLHWPSLGSTHKQKPVLMRNTLQEGRRVFRDASARGGAFFQTPALGRGLAVGDLDNDGWPDLVVSNTNSPAAVLRNVAAAASPTTRWLGVRLWGRDHRDIVGSTVILEGSTRTLTRFVKNGGSYLSVSDPRILFGLGEKEQIKKVTVKWSWGGTQSWENLEPGAYWDLHEGDAKATRSLAPR
jgi:hypothetical protein